LKTSSFLLLFRLWITVTVVQSLSLRGEAAITITNQPSADTTLFETFPTNNLGAADLTSGSTAAVARSRALLKFELQAVVPSDASINSVALTLTATRQAPGGAASNFRLFRLLRPWAEGNKTGTHGAPATAGESTWNDRAALTEGGQWSAPGAASPVDFLSAASSEATTDQAGHLQFASSSNVVSDVQFWQTHPTNNYGWILISDAENVPQTVTHFASREDATNAPSLVISLTPASAGAVPNIIQFGIVTNTFTFVFTAQAQQSYTIHYLSALTAAAWQPLTYFAAPSVETNVTVVDPISSGQRFYRVEADARSNDRAQTQPRKPARPATMMFQGK
jgi:hypothetical protein